MHVVSFQAKDMPSEEPDSSALPTTQPMASPETRRVVGILKSTALFQGLPESELERIASLAVPMLTYQNQTLMEEGERGAEIMVVVRGRVSVFLESISPPVEIGINRLGPGEVVGEMVLAGLDVRSATVVACEAGEVLRLPGPPLRDMLRADPALGMIVMSNVAEVLANRLRGMNRRVMNLLRQRYF